tara:strand:+ start:19417 stop:20745 length:1329 start_codon:yes stop_codon:yes gene_type:complete
VYKKLVFILFLAFLLGALLYLKPFDSSKKQLEKIETFLPEADLAGRVYLLDFLTESTDLMLFNEISQRQFLTSEFVLSLAKKFGLDVQNPVYIFANERGDAGSVVPLYTTQKLKSALDRISLDNDVKDTLIGQDHIYHLTDYQVHIFHRDHFLFIYYGDYFYEIYHESIVNRKRKMADVWQGLFINPIFPNENLVLYSESKALKQFGMDHAYMAHDSDSSGFHLKSCIKINDSIPFFVKDSGQAIKFSTRSKRTIDLHMNTANLTASIKALLIEKLSLLTSKISFPISDFIEIWNGDFCFEEGGFYLVSEKYIETELDDNFEPTQVEKTRYKNVPRYSLMFTVQEPANQLLNKLLSKGILTQEDEQFRFLFSPQLKLRLRDDQVVFYSTVNPPRNYMSSMNRIQWTYMDTDFEFQVDSLSDKRVFGSIEIPMKKILESIAFL